MHTELKENEQLLDMLDEFLGSRFCSEELQAFFYKNKATLNVNLYRGMAFPKHLMVVGSILEEWNGSSHWSKDVQIAKNFATDFYIPEDLEDELNNDSDLLRSENVSEASELFIPVIFELTTAIKAIDVDAMITGSGLCWEKEKEVAFIGVDFVMKSIRKNDEDEYYYVEVEQIQ